MSTGSGFFGEEPGAGGSPRRSGEGASPEQPEQPAQPAQDEATFADVLNSLTLDSGRSRRRRGKDKKEKKGKKDKHQAPPELEPEVSQDDGAPAEAEWPQEADRHTEDAHPVSAAHAMWPEADSEAEPGYDVDAAVPSARPGGQDDIGAGLADTAIVRPYAWTGGRTKANHVLELETLVSSTERAFTEAGPLQVEHRSMVDICRQPRSVAEVAALLGVPLGVARVLISDVADLGLVAVHQTATNDEGAEARLTLMERVLSGLRRL